MKNMTAIVFVILLFAGCRKAEDQPVEIPVILPLEHQTTAALAWTDFLEDSTREIDSTQTRIEGLRSRIYLAKAKDKVKIRRVANKTEYQLEKLRRELRDHDAWFAKQIDGFTAKDAAKIDAFEVYFKTKLGGIQSEIDNCNGVK